VPNKIMGSDDKDKKEARKIAIALIVLVLMLVVASALMMPMFSDIYSAHIADGLGLKNAAVISFFLTTFLMIVLALTAGDGLLGEIQFMIGGFLLFFVIIWLMIAWIF
jgi:hypothetical protein